jgi:sn-glycerol 3-phosphate transport system substrate-binding protein
MLTRWRLGALGFALLVAAALVPLGAGAQAAVSLKYYYPVGASGPLNKLMTDLVNDFNASPDPSRAGLRGQLCRGNGQSHDRGDRRHTPRPGCAGYPELFSSWTGMPSGLLMTSSPRMAARLGSTTSTALSYINARASGHVYNIPWQRSTPIFYYNKDMFRKAGLDPSQAPKTWTQLVE